MRMIYSRLMRVPLGLALAIASGTAAGAERVGSQACAACHPAIYRSFQQTPMSRSSGRVGAGEAERFEQNTFRDAPGKYAYTVGREAGQYYFDFREQSAQTRDPIQGRRKLQYFVGSGTAAHSYLMEVDGFLYEAPVAYYHDSASWKPAPGFAGFDYPYLTRPILPGCLQCHASGIQHISGTQNAYASTPFLEGGVACERCHGPGSEHIAGGKPMVNPAKLAPAQRDSICEQCHLSGEIRVPKMGQDDQALPPGDRLADHLTVFVRAGSASTRRVTSHAENFAQSACKRSSGDKMWCGTCHDPHSIPAANEKAAYFRAKCLSCHQQSDCNAPTAFRQAKADDCTACHMPRNPVSDIEHVVFTDHSIRRRPEAVSSVPSATADLVPFRGGIPSSRDLGLAYAMIGRREQNALYLDRAFSLLKQAVSSGARDSQTLSYLAEFYRDRRDDANALPLYEEVWRTDRSQYATAAALGAYRMQRGDVEEAMRFWKQALAISPALPLTRLNLAGAQWRSGQADDAQETLRKALEFNPAFQEARNLLDMIVRDKIVK
jgi:hypothetical protein